MADITCKLQMQFFLVFCLICYAPDLVGAMTGIRMNSVSWLGIDLPSKGWSVGNVQLPSMCNNVPLKLVTRWIELEFEPGIKVTVCMQHLNWENTRTTLQSNVIGLILEGTCTCSSINLSSFANRNPRQKDSGRNQTFRFWKILLTMHECLHRIGHNNGRNSDL